jgi:hypothetical protein
MSERVVRQADGYPPSAAMRRFFHSAIWRALIQIFRNFAPRTYAFQSKGILIPI